MPDNRAWSDGFYTQACEDLDAARALFGRSPGAATTPSVVAMLVQMALEKLAKAAVLRSDASHAMASAYGHGGVSHLVTLLSSRRSARRLGVPKESVKKLAGWAALLERRHPSLAAHYPEDQSRDDEPCLEYPWKRDGKIKTPAHDLDVVQWFRVKHATRGVELLHFAQQVRAQFRTIFP